MLCLLSFFFLYGSAFGSFNFIDNGDGTVTDARTGLVWLKNANPCGVKNWVDAVAYCSSLASGQAGLTDGSTAGQWRLPSIEELEGIGTDPPATWEPGILLLLWTMPGAPFTNVHARTATGRARVILPTSIGTWAWPMEPCNTPMSYNDIFVWPVRELQQRPNYYYHHSLYSA